MLKWKNRDVYVIRSHGGSSDWTDDSVVVEIAGTGDQEIVKKGEIEGWDEATMGPELSKGFRVSGPTEQPKADKAKK